MKRDLKFFLSLTILSIAGCVILGFSTRQGPGVGGDATIYITSAKNLVNGPGLGIVTASGEFRLLPYFPPFFPLTLAFFTWLGCDAERAALWLNILLFGLTIVTAGWLLFRSGVGRRLALLGASLITVSPVLIPTFSWAMAEPLAIWLGLLSLGLLLVYLDRQGSTLLLIAAGWAAGLSILTRYSMAAFLAAEMAGLFLLNKGNWRVRLGRLAGFSIAGILPGLIWMGFDFSRTATVSSRSVEHAGGMVDRILGFWPQLKEVILFWIIPDSWIAHPPYPGALNSILAAGLALFLLGVSIGMIWKGLQIKLEDPVRPLFRLGLFAGFSTLAYTALIAVVYFATYPPITIGTRMFSPLHIAAILLLVLFTAGLRKTDHWGKNAGLVLAAGLGLTVLWWGGRSMKIVQQNSREGMGFNATAWKQSETIQAVKEIPENIPLVTNEEMAVYYLTGRRAYPLAEIYLDEPLQEFSRYGDGDLEEDEAQLIFRTQRAELALFNSITAQLETLYGSRTEDRVRALTEGLEVVFRGEDGAIYRYP